MKHPSAINATSIENEIRSLEIMMIDMRVAAHSINLRTTGILLTTSKSSTSAFGREA